MMSQQRLSAMGILLMLALIGASVAKARGADASVSQEGASAPEMTTQLAAPSQPMPNAGQPPNVTEGNMPPGGQPAASVASQAVQEAMRAAAEQKAREEEKARQEEMAAAQREKRQMLDAQSSRRDLVLKMTHDEALAELLSTSPLAEAELAKLLAKYDFKANLEAEKMRLERQTRQLQADLDKSWISSPCKETDFVMTDLRQTGKLILGFVENKSGKDIERFRATLSLTATDGTRETVRGEFIDQFAAGERRRISFTNPWKDKKVSEFKVSESRAYRKPTL